MGGCPPILPPEASVSVGLMHGPTQGREQAGDFGTGWLEQVTVGTAPFSGFAASHNRAKEATFWFDQVPLLARWHPTHHPCVTTPGLSGLILIFPRREIQLGTFPSGLRLVTPLLKIKLKSQCLTDKVLHKAATKERKRENTVACLCSPISQTTPPIA